MPEPVSNDDGEAVPEPDGPITPEVVRGRGRARGFGGMGGMGGGAGTARRETPTVRIAAAALAALGALLAFYGVGLVMNPEVAVCANARIIIKDHLAAAAEADDDSDADQTTTTTSGEADSATTTTIGGIDPVAAAGIDSDEEADARECTEVLAVATALDESDDDVQLPTESLVRTLGTVILVTAAIEIAGGVLTLRRRTTGFRRLAVAGAILGALTSLIVGIGIIGVVLYLGILFGLVYSRDARATFGEPGGRFGGGARRRLAGAGPAAAGDDDGGDGGGDSGDGDGDSSDDGGDGGDDDSGGGGFDEGRGRGGRPPRGGPRPRGDLPGGFAKPRK